MIATGFVAPLLLMGGSAQAGMPPRFDAELEAAPLYQPMGTLALSPRFAPSFPDLQQNAASPADQAGTAAPQQNDIVVTARSGPVAIDPFAPVNEASFKVTQAVDQAITRPVAMAYEKGIPSPIRSGLRNFFLNLHEIDVFLNFIAQVKIGKAAETAGRFVINTTVGVAGLFDIAKRKPFHLPRRRNSLANTLGFYGVGPGPFFFLPLIGPTTLRDLIGNSVDGLVVPTLLGKPFTKPIYTIPSSLIRSLDHRAENDTTLTVQQNDANPYAASRADYLTRRQREIDHLRGRDRHAAPAGPTASSAPPVVVAPQPAPAPTPTPAPAVTPTPSAGLPI